MTSIQFVPLILSASFHSFISFFFISAVLYSYFHNLSFFNDLYLLLTFHLIPSFYFTFSIPDVLSISPHFLCFNFFFLLFRFYILLKKFFYLFSMHFLIHVLLFIHSSIPSLNLSILPLSSGLCSQSNVPTTSNLLLLSNNSSIRHNFQSICDRFLKLHSRKVTSELY